MDEVHNPITWVKILILHHKWKLPSQMFTWVKVLQYLFLKVHLLFDATLLYCFHNAFYIYQITRCIQTQLFIVRTDNSSRSVSCTSICRSAPTMSHLKLSMERMNGTFTSVTRGAWNSSSHFTELYLLFVSSLFPSIFSLFIPLAVYVSLTLFLPFFLFFCIFTSLTSSPPIPPCAFDLLLRLFLLHSSLIN